MRLQITVRLAYITAPFWPQLVRRSHFTSFKGLILQGKFVPARLILLEPSKIGAQHITLLEAYLRALQTIDVAAMGIELIYAADSTSHAALAPDVRAKLRHEPISVINAEHRRWIAKGLLEVQVVEKAIADLKPRDMLIVTCLTAPALLIVEALARRIGDKRVMVVLHSELESLVDPSLRSPKTWGFWSYRWSRMRRPGSPLRIAVLADYVRDRLDAIGNPALMRSEVGRLTFPVGTAEDIPATDGHHRLTFIGFKTRMKGFESFEQLARANVLPDRTFNVVCAGQVENVVTGTTRPFDSSGFLGEVGQSTLAIFPYTHGYEASLSAAVLDALSTGVHIVATRRNCFMAIHREFGDSSVTLYDTAEELSDIVANDAFLATARAGAAERRAKLAQSSFGAAATEADFRQLLAGWGFVSAAVQAMASAP
jgi:hypothetical protein